MLLNVMKWKFRRLYIFQNLLVDKFNKYFQKKKIKTKIKLLYAWITIEIKKIQKIKKKIIL